MIPKKHKEILNELTKKYKSDKNVVGFYLLGSLANGKATPKSDIDIEIVFKKRKKKYELIHKRIKGIKVDLSMYSLDYFKKDFSKHPYLMYCALNHIIMYDPDKVIINHLNKIKEYFKNHKNVKKFWQDKERKYKKEKLEGKERENFFDVCKIVKKEFGK